jgi:hypothetical protein
MVNERHILHGWMNNEELEYPLVICYSLHIEIHPLSIYFRYVRFSEGIFEENIRHKQHVLCFEFLLFTPWG